MFAGTKTAVNKYELFLAIKGAYPSGLACKRSFERLRFWQNVLASKGSPIKILNLGNKSLTYPIKVVQNDFSLSASYPEGVWYPDMALTASIIFYGSSDFVFELQKELNKDSWLLRSVLKKLT